MATIVIRYGVNRRAKMGKRSFTEHRCGDFEIEGCWSSDETHRQIRTKIREANPGWSITGYCDNSPLTR